MSEPYIDAEAADAYAEAELDAAAWTALTADQQEGLLARASDEIDQVRFQGRKYDLEQEREFPRVYDEQAVEVYPGSAAGSGVWDWDDDTAAAIVPEAVLMATWLQALSIAQGERDARQDARHDGVASQSAGGVSESYSGPQEILCRRAAVMLRRYRLKSGRIV